MPRDIKTAKKFVIELFCFPIWYNGECVKFQGKKSLKKSETQNLKNPKQYFREDHSEKNRERFGKIRNRFERRVAF